MKLALLKRLKWVLAVYIIVSWQPVLANSCMGDLLDRNEAVKRPLAEDLYRTADSHSKAFWDSFSRDFQAATREVISSTDAFFAAKRSNDPYILFLESIGFSIPKTARGTVKVPHLIDMVSSLQKLILQQIRLGKIREQDALWPTMIVTATAKSGKDQLSNFEVLAGGNLPISKTYVESSRTSKESKFLSHHDFVRIIERGYYPLSGLQNASYATHGRSTIEIMHDLAHWSSFLSEPTYMTSVRREVRQILKDMSQGEVSPILFNEGSPMIAKLFAALESLVVVRPEKVDSIGNEYLGLSKLLKRKAYPSLRDIENHYARLKPEEIQKIVDALEPRFADYFSILGGSHKDLLSFQNIPVNEFPHMYLLRSSQSYNVDRLARFAKFVLNTRKFSAEDWVVTLISPYQSEKPRWVELSGQQAIAERSNPQDSFLYRVLNN